MSAFAYVIFVIVALLACGLGAVGAYFYYRARHREAVAELEALDQDLAEREEELHRLHYQFRNTYPGGPSFVQTEAQAEMQNLRDELEQKKNDYNILRQDFDLEIGILKQELDQLREEKSNVDHTRRHLARKDAELEERETDLVKKEADLVKNEEDVTKRAKHIELEIAARMKHLEDELAERKKQLEDEFGARARRMEEELAKRDRQFSERRQATEEEREALDQERTALRQKQMVLDEELLELPAEKFTGRQEALLIKRLRQQIKLQRNELEQVQQLYHHATTELQALSASGEKQPNTEIAQEKPVGADTAPRNERPSLADDENGTGDYAPEVNDTFPSFSTLSSHVERRRESASRSEVYPLDSPNDAESRDDLTSLPGIDARLQAQLHRLGVTSYDQIARWSSADVRRVSERLEIDRKTIQDHWIIHAQSHLFSRKVD